MEIPLTKQTVVDCNSWHRGHAGDSRLLTSDAKRCCLGFAAQQSGVDDKQMCGRLTPSQLNIQIAEFVYLNPLGCKCSSVWVLKAMKINDGLLTDDHEKISLLTEHWKKLGEDFSVRFTNIPQRKDQETT